MFLLLWFTIFCVFQGLGFDCHEQQDANKARSYAGATLCFFLLMVLIVNKEAISGTASQVKLTSTGDNSNLAYLGLLVVLLTIFCFWLIRTIVIPISGFFVWHGSCEPRSNDYSAELVKLMTQLNVTLSFGIGGTVIFLFFWKLILRRWWEWFENLDTSTRSATSRSATPAESATPTPGTQVAGPRTVLMSPSVEQVSYDPNGGYSAGWIAAPNEGAPQGG